jgi:CheY-like chemotaxis protein
MKKVLLVDDDQLVLRLYSKKLEQAGIEVQTATDGLLAMKAMSTAPPDLVVLDLMMPRLSGDDVLKFMATKPRLANVCVVVLTNSFMSDQARSVAPFKISRAINKGDSTPTKLLELVNQLLADANAASPAPAPVNTAAVAAAPPPPPAAPAANHDTSVVKNEAHEHFLQTAAKTYADLRAVSWEFALDPSASSRSGNLSEFYRQVHHLTGAAGLARLSNIGLMSGALEALLFELGLKPQFINPSVARTIAASVEFLGVLIEDVRAGRPTEPMSRDVLVVDDDPLANRIAMSALTRANLMGQAAEGPVAALELLSRKQFALILLDIEMPQMTGFEVCRRLRSMPGYEKTPVIYVTAHSDFESRSRSIISGGNDLIAKPIFPIELAVKAVAHLIGSSRSTPTAVA